MSALEFVGLHESSAWAHSGLFKKSRRCIGGTFDMSNFAQSVPPVKNHKIPGLSRRLRYATPPPLSPWRGGARTPSPEKSVNRKRVEDENVLVSSR